jgi:hypothetical protein
MTPCITEIVDQYLRNYCSALVLKPKVYNPESFPGRRHAFAAGYIRCFFSSGANWSVNSMSGCRSCYFKYWCPTTVQYIKCTTYTTGYVMGDSDWLSPLDVGTIGLHDRTDDRSERWSCNTFAKPGVCLRVDSTNLSLSVFICCKTLYISPNMFGSCWTDISYYSATPWPLW